jgi:Fur family ferric uptake transcriptional regulator
VGEVAQLGGVRQEDTHPVGGPYHPGKMFLDQPRLRGVTEPGRRGPHVHGLEDPVAPQGAKIISPQDGRIGWYEAASKHGNHAIRHLARLLRGTGRLDDVSDSSLADVLRSRGLRLTAQRQLVLDAVRELGHATPDQVHTSVSRVAAGVNITTVYRTLELLEELGLVTHAHLSHGAPTFHAVGDVQHVHLVCRTCGGVSEVASGLLSSLAETLDAEHGFMIDMGHVALFGVCAHCGEKHD